MARQPVTVGATGNTRRTPLTSSATFASVARFLFDDVRMQRYSNWLIGMTSGERISASSWVGMSTQSDGVTLYCRPLPDGKEGQTLNLNFTDFHFISNNDRLEGPSPLYGNAARLVPPLFGLLIRAQVGKHFPPRAEEI